MDIDTFRQELVELVYLSSTSLTTFRLKDKGFKKIAREMCRLLEVPTGHYAVRHFVISLFKKAGNVNTNFKGEILLFKNRCGYSRKSEFSRCKYKL